MRVGKEQLKRTNQLEGHLWVARGSQPYPSKAGPRWSAGYPEGVSCPAESGTTNIPESYLPLKTLESPKSLKPQPRGQGPSD